ncbi:MAG: SsrA-binding protein SmpB [Planctomycetes bacterium]|nr:SsrA-binding protein SmpB [Planctomycetota bacterium]
MSQGSRSTPRIVNKKARFNFEILEKVEAGIALTGSEVKSLRAGQASLDEAFAVIRNREIFLRQCNISPYPQAGYAQHEPTRERKLLMKRREIGKWQDKVTLRGLTLIPLVLYFNDRGLVKVQIGLARGKTHGDKRSDMKKRDHQREMERAMRRGR